MRIFLDPGFENECTIWLEGGNVQTLQGNIEQNCIRIRNYVIDNYEDEDGNFEGSYQRVDVYLDIMGVGRGYAHTLERMGVKYSGCTYNKIIK